MSRPRYEPGQCGCRACCHADAVSPRSVLLGAFVQGASGFAPRVGRAEMWLPAGSSSGSRRAVASDPRRPSTAHFHRRCASDGKTMAGLRSCASRTSILKRTICVECAWRVQRCGRLLRHYPQRQASLHASRSSNATCGRGKGAAQCELRRVLLYRDYDYDYLSTDGRTRTRTALAGREKQCNGYARQQQVCVSHGILCPLPLSPSSPVILRLPPAHDPLLLLPLDLRRAWSMPRSGQARVGAAIAYPALGRHMSRTRGDGGRRANNGGFAALRPRPALRTSSHTQRLQPLAQAQFKITAQRLEGYPGSARCCCCTTLGEPEPGYGAELADVCMSYFLLEKVVTGGFSSFFILPIPSRNTGVLETLRIPDQHAPSDTARRWASPATRTSGARYAVMCEFPCPLLPPFSAGSFLSVSRTGVLVSARTRRRATFVLVYLRGAPDYKQRHHFAPA
ncbi:hypothetical protein B0H13DRAFT_2672335 [Mycena leptocephala]|nr:hypothetical protein B0H13DRAFT_2672335 [Mycena leptocephala]